MVYTLIVKFPAVLPLIMVAWNMVYFVSTLVFTGYIKINVLKYIFLYAVATKTAYKGDLSQYMMLISMP